MSRPLTERLPAALTALAVQAGILALILFSLAVVRQMPREEETILTLAPPAPPPIPPRAIVIDGRPRLPLRPSRLPPPPAKAPPMLAPPQAPPPRPRDQVQPRDLARPLAPPAIAPPDKGTIQLNPPTGVEDEKRWEAEMARKNTPPDAGVAVGVGIGIVIQDPLCKLAKVLLGGLTCGAMPAHHDASDAQVEAAVAAANARKRALSDASVLMSQAKTGDKNAKDSSGGAAAGTPAGGTTGPGR